MRGLEPITFRKEGAETSSTVEKSSRSLNKIQIKFQMGVSGRDFHLEMLKLYTNGRGN